ncbi:MAG: hypothetical protein HOY69_30370 [Streptomyces sp.]|nr:hypothetical protein [Streptomyces sp.]
MTKTSPEVGDLVVDSDGQVGKLVARIAGTAWLRLPSGGREWTSPAEQVRAVKASELLSASVATVNARSRGQL